MHPKKGEVQFSCNRTESLSLRVKKKFELAEQIFEEMHWYFINPDKEIIEIEDIKDLEKRDQIPAKIYMWHSTFFGKFFPFLKFFRISSQRKPFMKKLLKLFQKTVCGFLQWSEF